METNEPVNPEPKQPDQKHKRPEMTKEHLDKRIEAIHDAVKQARSALLLCILASGAMLLCLWNTYASWDRDFAFLDDKDYVGIHEDPASPDYPTLKADKHGVYAADDVQNALEKKHQFTRKEIKEAWNNHVHSRPANLHEHQMHSWIDTQVVSIALLGIKISVSDFAIVGSIALAICSLYLLLCVRRENHEIGYLFREMSPAEFNCFGPHALTMVSSFMVFNISSLHSSRDSVIFKLNKEKGNRGTPEIRLIRKASSVLDLFPAITITATIICDFCWTHWNAHLGHMFFLSPFRPQELQSVFTTEFSSGEKIYFWVAEGFAMLAAFILWRMSLLVKDYDSGTRELLEDVTESLKDDGLIEPRWPTPEGGQPKEENTQDTDPKPGK